MLAYALFGALAGLAASFTLMLAARFAQGMAAAGTRVLIVAVVRDRYQGAAMAQIMSLVMIIFMIVPVLAPSFGQLILAFAGWRQLFILLALYGLALALWGGLRMPETLHAEDRLTLSAGTIWRAAAETLTDARLDRQHDRLDAGVRRPVRLHRLDPADRLRRVRAARPDRHRLRLHRRADGGELLCSIRGW